MTFRTLRPCLPALLAALVATAGCGASGGGGGGGWYPATSAGTPCSASGIADLCGMSGGQSAQLHCEGGLWVAAKLCDPGMVCTALPGGVLTCVADSSGSGSDAQGLDSGATDGSSGEKDTTTTVTDVWVGDAPVLADSSEPADVPAPSDTAQPKDTAPDIAKDTGTDVAKDTVSDTGPPTCKPACPAGSFCDLSTSPPSCVGGSCQLPTQWGPTTQKIASLAMPGAGVGCDLNGDGKPDNAFGSGLAMLGGQMNDGLSQSIAKGTLVLLLDTPNFKATGQTFTLSMLSGAMDGAGGCDPVSPTGNCTYLVSPASYDATAPQATCPALVEFSNAKVAGGKLSAGGAATNIQLALPFAGLNLNLTIHKALLQGSVVGGTTWKQTSGGLLCGVISKQDLEAAVQAIPDDQLAGLGMDKATLLQLLGSMLQADFSVSGGAKDAYSIALQWSSVPGEISGMTPN